MRTNENDICRDIANLHDNILAAGVIENQQLVARYTKLDDLHLSEERIKLLFAQPEIVISICRTNEEYFGSMRYLIICFENSDFLFFPAVVEGKDRILYIRTKRTYRGEEILQKVYDYLKKRQN